MIRKFLEALMGALQPAPQPVPVRVRNTPGTNDIRKDRR